MVAVPAGADMSHGRPGVPSPGMRVKVRFDDGQYYYGTIEEARSSKELDQGEGKTKLHNKNVEIVIRYDDGFTEDAEFPDPDFNLVMLGEYCE